MSYFRDLLSRLGSKLASILNLNPTKKVSSKREIKPKTFLRLKKKCFPRSMRRFVTA